MPKENLSRDGNCCALTVHTLSPQSNGSDLIGILLHFLKVLVYLFVAVQASDALLTLQESGGQIQIIATITAEPAGTCSPEKPVIALPTNAYSQNSQKTPKKVGK